MLTGVMRFLRASKAFQASCCLRDETKSIDSRLFACNFLNTLSTHTLTLKLQPLSSWSSALLDEVFEKDKSDQFSKRKRPQ